MEEQKTFGSIGKARRVRRGIVAAATVATALSSSLALAVPAGATSSLTAPGNATIVGAGSATTYDVMVKMGTLFNGAPSCDLYQPSTAASAITPQDFTCVVDSNPNQTSPAINGASVATTPANPFGDVAMQEPPVGSSIGIKILSNQGAKGAAGVTSGGVQINVANNVTFARSSRNLKTTDYKGLNFVAYARDGVSWSHYTTVENAKGKAAATPSNAVTNLAKADIQGVFNSGTKTNWSQLGGSSAPIVVFSAQVGSGTWDSWGGYVGSTASYKTSDPSNPVNCYDNTDATTCQGPAVIFENETASLKVSSLPTNLQSPTAAVLTHFAWDTASKTVLAAKKTQFVTPAACAKWIWGCTAGAPTGSNFTGWAQVFTLNTPTDTQVKADSMFFYSTGKYNYQCAQQAAGTKISTCGGLQPSKNYLYSIGNIDGVTPTQANILEGIFGSLRYIYNVYSNGSNTNINASPASTLNFVGEQGFMCRSHSATDINSNTGVSYRTEISNAILAEGFYPLSAGKATGEINNTPFDEGIGSISHPASAITTGTKYAPYTNTREGDGTGFCIVTTTDGNSSS
jgi:hypothetical protein